jgi:hypothetical protein
MQMGSRKTLSVSKMRREDLRESGEDTKWDSGDQVNSTEDNEGICDAERSDMGKFGERMD